jgi:hypothetical protein
MWTTQLNNWTLDTIYKRRWPFAVETTFADDKERPVPLQPAYGQITVRRAKACIFSGCESRPATVVPAGSSRSGDGGNEIVEAFDLTGRVWRLSE